MIFSKFNKTALVLLFLPFIISAQSVNLPLDHWAYGFLDRMATKKLYSSNALLCRPVARTLVAKFLLEIENNVNKDPGVLSRTEQRLFEQLKEDLGDELLALNNNLVFSTRERHTLDWHDSNSQLYLDLYGYEGIVSNKGTQYKSDVLLSETRMGGIIRGHLGGTIGYYMDARNSMTRGSHVKKENFDVSQGSPVVTSGATVYQDRATAYFIFEKPWLRVEAGQDEMEWGPGFHGGLSLSRNSPPVGLIRLSTRFSRIQFSSVHAFLRSSMGSKYLAGHRLDIRIRPGLYFGATETVVYGGRDIDFAYANPIMPYHIAEHHLGDKDNNTMSFDLTVLCARSVKLYTELFIDDMTSSESLLKYFGNKFAFLIGSYWVDPFKMSNVDLRFEYTRIEPFVYTHWDSINIYTNYDKSIGYWLGPNSDDLILQLGYQVGRDLRLELSLERIRKGKGDLDTHSQPESGIRKKFLDGIVEHRNLMGIKIIDQIRRDIYISLSYTYSDTQNLGRVLKNNSYDQLARLECNFNY
jgi:hypothetical protein